MAVTQLLMETLILYWSECFIHIDKIPIELKGIVHFIVGEMQSLIFPSHEHFELQ